MGLQSLLVFILHGCSYSLDTYLSGESDVTRPIIIASAGRHCGESVDIDTTYHYTSLSPEVVHETHLLMSSRSYRQLYTDNIKI